MSAEWWKGYPVPLVVVGGEAPTEARARAEAALMALRVMKGEMA
jgi:hypothetical protein